MSTWEILLQIFLWTIAILSSIIAYEFYTSKNGRLRLLMIELFCAKVIVYGGAAIWYLLLDFGYLTEVNSSLVRIALNSTMFFVMLKLWGFIRNNK